MNDKLQQLRQLMKENGADAYIITKFDPHQTEYADPYYNGTEFISGFTGSVATVVVTEDKAGLWTDSRYFLQAEKELPETFELHKMGEAGTPDVLEYAADFKKVAIDFATFPANAGKKLSRLIQRKNGELLDLDLVSPLWKNRDFAPSDGIFAYDERFSGESFASKLERVRAKMDAPYYIISSLDDIAWLLNIRSMGEFNTFNFLAYVLIGPEEVTLFMDQEIGEALPAGVAVRPYGEVFERLQNKKAAVAPTRTNYKILQSLTEPQLLAHDITAALKACKNSVEIANIRSANARDAALHVKFFKWVKEAAAGLTEFEIGEKLFEMRMAHGAKNHSFAPIVGYLENGAIVHYRAETDSKIVQKGGFLLIDSGANYEEGTTDITRTLAMGPLTQEEKIHYTLVLKGHIALALQKFPAGTHGAALDAITRKPLWDHLLNYGHGTGHGIGHFLNVHEGPCGIAPRAFEPLAVGNVLSNEPGLYLTGQYGIRLENTILVKEAGKNFGIPFLEFETLSFIPFEKEAIAKELLSEEESAWLDAYHAKTYELLAPSLNSEEAAWLKDAIAL